MSAFHGKSNDDSNNDIQSGLDNSIEEKASMLLDYMAMNELQGEPRKRLSRTMSAKILPQHPREVFYRNKALPQLPKLLPNGDDAWAITSRQVITTRDTAHDKYVTFDDEGELDSFPPPVSRELTLARKGSAPPLPRKSSKGRSRNPEQRELKNIRVENRQQSEPRKLTKMEQQSVRSPLRENRGEALLSSFSAQQVMNKQIDNTLVASKAFKPMVKGLLSESPAALKKRGNKGNSVLSMMKNAISECPHEKSLKKCSQAPKNEQLLDSSLSQLPYYMEEPSTVNALELRTNNGEFLLTEF